MNIVITSTSALEVLTSHSEIFLKEKLYLSFERKPMEDYRLPAPLVGMLKATNLSGMPHVQTDLRATKISVTITWDLATSAHKKPKKQPAKKKPSETPSTSKHPPTSQCPPPEIPTLPSPTPATIVRRQVTAPTPSPTAPPVAKKPRHEPSSRPVTKPTRQPFTGEYQVKAVQANYLRSNYTNHTDPNNVVRDFLPEGHIVPAAIQALRPKTGSRHTHYLVNDWIDGSEAPEYYLLTYKDTPEYDHYKRLWQLGDKSPPEHTKEWNDFCTTGDILLLRPPEAMS